LPCGNGHPRDVFSGQRGLGHPLLRPGNEGAQPPPPAPPAALPLLPPEALPPPKAMPPLAPVAVPPLPPLLSSSLFGDADACQSPSALEAGFPFDQSSDGAVEASVELSGKGPLNCAGNGPLNPSGKGPL